MAFNDMHKPAPMDGGSPTDSEAEAPQSPRHAALMELLKFLSHSEAKRAMPKQDTSPEISGSPDKGQEGMTDDDLEALRHMAGR